MLAPVAKSSSTRWRRGSQFGKGRPLDKAVHLAPYVRLTGPGSCAAMNHSGTRHHPPPRARAPRLVSKYGRRSRLSRARTRSVSWACGERRNAFARPCNADHESTRSILVGHREVDEQVRRIRPTIAVLASAVRPRRRPLRSIEVFERCRRPISRALRSSVDDEHSHTASIGNAFSSSTAARAAVWANGRLTADKWGERGPSESEL